MDLLRTILAARLTQLLVRYLATFLIAHASYDASRAQAASGTVAEVVVALVMFGLDHAAHALRDKARARGWTWTGPTPVDGKAFDVDHWKVAPPLKIVVLGLLAAGALGGLAGCANSKPFQLGAPAAGTFIDEARDYVNADASLEDGERVRRLEALDALHKVITAGKLASVETVSQAWDQVKPFYVAYFEADATLDPEELDLRRGNVLRYDALISAERSRPLRGPPAAK